MPLARVLLYVATIGALALVARSLFMGIVALDVALIALGIYVALVTCGTLVLRLGMFADVTSRGPDDARGVALTFDDGPNPETTPAVLELLDEAGVKATFFVIGKKAEAHPDLVRMIHERGHSIGVHSFAHDRLFSLRTMAFVRRDLERSIEVIEAITGERPTLFRPPMGHTSARLVRAADDLDLRFVGWSVRGIDGLASARAERVAARILPKLRDGAIVLMHDAAERDDFRPVSLDVLPAVLSAMDRKDLRGVRVDAWVPAA